MESQLSAAGVLVAGIGVFATALGYVLRQYNEDRRIARTVLFNLLGIWEVCIARSEPPHKLIDSALDEYKAAVTEVFGAEAANQIDWNDDVVRKLIKPLLVRLVVANLPQLTEGMSEAYLSSLAKLSERFPVLAYRLSGREKIENLFSAIEEYEAQTNQALEQAIASEDSAAVVETFRNLTRNSITRQVIDDIARDLLQVAWTAGISNWLRCKLIVQKSKQQVEIRQKLLIELRKEFVTLLRQLISAHGQ